MANRHKFARGGRSGRPLYAGASSNVAKEINATHGFKSGGAVAVGKAFGGRAKGKAGYARGGRSPFSSATFGSHGAHAGKAKARGGAAFAEGGAVFAKGGAIGKEQGGAVAKKFGGPIGKEQGGAVAKKFGGPIGKKRGGECKDEDEEDDDKDDDKDERARGGRMHHEGSPEGAAKGGMHYIGGKGRRRRNKGGHVDVYETHGGTHHWMDDDHSKAKGGAAGGK